MKHKGFLIGYFVASLVALLIVGSREETVGHISLIIPEATTNLVTNPSIEIDTTGFTAVGAGTALSQELTDQRRGIYSLEVTPDTGNNDGVYYTIALSTTTQYTFSVDVKGADSIPYRLRIYDVTGTADLATLDFTGDGEWHRQEVTFTTTSHTSHRLYIEKDTDAGTDVFYVDGLQVEALGYATTYCDGDQDGCSWSYGPHESTSGRSAAYRGGGQVIDLNADYDVTLHSWDGFGMPPLIHNTQSLAQQPGALLQSLKVEPRILTIAASVGPGTESALYTDRAAVIDALKPDLVATLQAVTLRYTGASQIVEIPCVYDAGLQGSWPHLSHERFVLRLICYQPYFVGEGNHAAQLDTYDSNTVQRLVTAKIDGAWTGFGPPSGPVTGQVDSIVIADSGIMYIAGTFTNYDGNADADYIAQYDPSTDTWDDLGTPPNGSVSDLALSIDQETLYAVGTFTNIGGGGANRVAAYDISAGTWSALGTGADGPVYAVEVGPDGLLYIGGDFANAGGGAAANVAKWDPDATSWAALGTGPNNVVKDMVISGKYLYAVGTFTQAGGSAAGYIAKWSIIDATWSTIGDGLGGAVNRIAIAPDGLIYVGGTFTTTGAGDAALRVAVWNGSVWAGLGAGVDDDVWALAVAPDGSLYVGGEFTTAGGRSSQDNARWTGHAWVYTDFNLGSTPGTYKVTELLFHGDDLYVGNDRNGLVITGDTVTLTNEGSATAYPIISLTSTAELDNVPLSARIIINETTGQYLYLDYDLSIYEILYIDLTPGAKRVYSSFWGEVPEAVAPVSDLANFGLAPGENVIRTFIWPPGLSDGDGYIQWQDRYWSVDGAE